MSRTIKVSLLSAAIAFGLVAVSVTSARSRPATSSASLAPCKWRWVHKKATCLRVGEYCSPSNQSLYAANGLICLTRVTGNRWKLTATPTLSPAGALTYAQAVYGATIEGSSRFLLTNPTRCKSITTQRVRCRIAEARVDACHWGHCTGLICLTSLSVYVTDTNGYKKFDPPLAFRDPALSWECSALV